MSIADDEVEYHTYYIFSYIPPKQGFLAPIEEKVVIDIASAESVDALIEGLHVPRGGYCLIVDKNNTTKVQSKVVNKRVT